MSSHMRHRRSPWRNSTCGLRPSHCSNENARHCYCIVTDFRLNIGVDECGRQPYFVYKAGRRGLRLNECDGGRGSGERIGVTGMDGKTKNRATTAAPVEGGRPTLKTIAFMTGLGVTTVSRALKDAPDIGAETKERVRLVAKQIGYQPNRAGVRLRTGKTNVISLVLTLEEEIMASPAPWSSASPKFSPARNTTWS